MAQRGGSAMRLVLAVVLFAVAGGLWLYNAQERGARNEYNTVVEELVNQGEYEAAYERLVVLMEDGAESIEQEVKETAAKCAVHVANQEGATMDHTREWLRRAEALDPSKLSDLQKRLLHGSQSVEQ